MSVLTKAIRKVIGKGPAWGGDRGGWPELYLKVPATQEALDTMNAALLAKFKGFRVQQSYKRFESHEDNYWFTVTDDNNVVIGVLISQVTLKPNQTIIGVSYAEAGADCIAAGSIEPELRRHEKRNKDFWDFVITKLD